jgi:hypothetical protein
MAGWKTKMCGDNRFNFYGWIFAGILCLGSSMVQMVEAFRAKSAGAVQDHLLLGIYLLLLGQFGLSLQNYCARVAKAIEEGDAKK